MDCKCSTLTGYSGVTNLLPPERLSATGPPPPLAACTTCADNTLCCAEGVRPAMRPRPPCKGQGTDDQGAVPPFVLGAGGSDTWSSLAARARARRRSSVEVVSLASDATALTLALASKGSPKVDHSQPLTLFQRNSTGSCSPNKEGALMSSQRSLSQPSSLAQGKWSARADSANQLRRSQQLHRGATTLHCGPRMCLYSSLFGRVA
eukprot:1136993-Pelagomonas_calceolata.AAC.10